MTEDENPESFSLTEDVPLTPEQAQAISDRLHAFLTRSDWPLDDALIAAQLYLGMLDLFLRQNGAEQRLSPAEAIAYFSESMEKNHYQRLLQIARRPSASRAMQRAFLGMLATFRNTQEAARRRGALNTFWTIVWSYARYLARRGTFCLAPLEAPVRHADLAAVRFDPREPFAAEILRPLLCQAIERGDLLLRGGDLMRGYGLLLIFFAMSRWYAIALAARRGATAVARADLLEAVALAERYYGARSPFPELFETYPVLNGIFDNVLRQKNFAQSMIR